MGYFLINCTKKQRTQPKLPHCNSTPSNTSIKVKTSQALDKRLEKAICVFPCSSYIYCTVCCSISYFLCCLHAVSTSRYRFCWVQAFGPFGIICFNQDKHRGFFSPPLHAVISCRFFALCRAMWGEHTLRLKKSRTYTTSTRGKTYLVGTCATSQEYATMHKVITKSNKSTCWSTLATFFAIEKKKVTNGVATLFTFLACTPDFFFLF